MTGHRCRLPLTKSLADAVWASILNNLICLFVVWSLGILRKAEFRVSGGNRTNSHWHTKIPDMAGASRAGIFRQETHSAALLLGMQVIDVLL